MSIFGLTYFLNGPQERFVSSGDGYNHRFDEILTHFEGNERCVDNLPCYDTDLEEYWWRVIHLLDKVAFARQEVDFAGFNVTNATIEPPPKYMDAIRDFSTLTSITDIRSWFGLVNQVSNYAKLSHIIAPFN